MNKSISDNLQESYFHLKIVPLVFCLCIKNKAKEQWQSHPKAGEINAELYGGLNSSNDKHLQEAGEPNYRISYL